MITLGLQRISRLLTQTPLPWRAIHVAGTNGKGSICAYISAMLSAYNRSPGSTSLPHGRFTSPHLTDRWDCISINNTPISGSVFRAVEQEVLERNHQMVIGASEFEVLTATTFELFTHEGIDVGVVEVGMGGRLDATNVLGESGGLQMEKGARLLEFRPAPLVSVISSIGLDHQAFLGNTLEEIAREKAGIIKSGVPVVFDDTNPKEVIDVLRSVAEEKSSPIIDRTSIVPAPLLGRTTVSHRKSSLADHLEKILSRHNIDSREPAHVKQNITLAYLATWTALQELGLVKIRNHDHLEPMKHATLESKLSELAEQMLQAAGKVNFPGRQQMINIKKLTGRKQDILLDGAHNAQSAMALAETVNGLRQQGSGGAVTWVLAASDTKDVKEILSPLLRGGDAVFAVEFGPVDGMPWVKPLSASRLLHTAREVVESPENLSMYDCGNDILAALKSASAASEGRPMVVAGSLYLVGDVLRLLRDG